MTRIDQARKLRGALEQCARWFEEYAVSHQKQGKHDKADLNFGRAQYARYAASGAVVDAPVDKDP